MAKRAKQTHNPPSDLILPPPELAQHNHIERIDGAIADSQGRPSRPYRSVDILTLMERRGSITPGMHQAGEDFRNAFRQAQLHPLKAADLSRPFIDHGAPNRGSSRGSDGARDKVWQAILVVGGLGSPGGSCLWHVIGWERALKEWALEQGWNGRFVSQETASGILIAALGALEGYNARMQCRNAY